VVTVTFPSTEEENNSLELIIFPANQEGKAIECAITYTALRQYFDADYSDPLFAFMSGRKDIEDIASRLIAEGRFEEDGLILIKPEDMN